MPPDRETWLNATVEETLDPDPPICHPHHHLRDYPHNRCLLDDLLRDTGSGQTVVQTVFVECVFMYRTDGPDEVKPVGETEFIQGVADWKRTWRPVPTGFAAYDELACQNCRGAGAILSAPHRTIRGGSLHIREQFPGR